MLWSDPKNEPPQELREMQSMLRRASVLIAVAVILALLILGVR
ncbi:MULTISPECIES: morphogenic membrane protein MmpB [Streptomyces]|uniref:Uncharacterized protein n=1 Tax=Streptomyces albus (strain ATCC 21838 / DSM 41398 / FERM P-419 / JCM 4703 / NBRC 107858) TaxID=1081613 RepID=A0A0B5EQZ2_STRA4|nr:MULTISPECIES: hypothetical protein [Streptomyces]AJE85223.1 hypothetical protein SLNWT_4847 [Streptomyces albus]AOU79530.1 hypothetical protein SLNHY_4839 [Streptomyces albus]